MTSFRLRIMMQALPFLLISPALALGQTVPTRGEATAAMKSATKPETAKYTTQQIDQLIAPIALYPDQLLAQVLMAATYSGQLVEAAEWLEDAANAELKEDALVAALEPLSWDPSVKALVAFPQIIVMMTEHLEWTQAIGVAFATQQAAVMNRVQTLRQLAVKSQRIRKVKNISVRKEGPFIVIGSAKPDRVFVPIYNPTVVYGPWPHRDYAPVYLPPPRFAAEPRTYRRYRVETVEPGMDVIDYPVIAPLWGWSRPEWRTGRISIEAAEYTRITRTAPPPRDHAWHHSGPVVLVFPPAPPLPSAPPAGLPAGTVAPARAAAVVTLPQRAASQPDAVRVEKAAPATERAAGRTPAPASEPGKATPDQGQAAGTQPSAPPGRDAGKAAADKAAADKVAADKAAADKASAEKAHADKAAADKAAADKAAADRAAAEKARAEKAAADRLQAEKAQADRARADKAAADRAQVEKAQAEKARAEKAAADRARAEKAAADRAQAEKAQADRARAEKAAAGKANAEKAAAEKARVEKAAADRAAAPRAVPRQSDGHREAPPAVRSPERAATSEPPANRDPAGANRRDAGGRPAEPPGQGTSAPPNAGPPAAGPPRRASEEAGRHPAARPENNRKGGDSR